MPRRLVPLWEGGEAVLANGEARGMKLRVIPTESDDLAHELTTFVAFSA